LALHASAGAVAAQALRRIGAEPAPTAAHSGALTVLRAGRVAALPDAALTYAEGRILAAGAPVR
ncbi:glutamate racemase, partial [Streptomyces sp. SID6648]|nr:glutamate racemase [Streptomyces sp. SID6648]